MPEDESSRYEFYSAQYARFGSKLDAEIRHAAYGEDFQHQGWRGLAEQKEIVALASRRPGANVLDIACGSGGASLALVAATSCRLTGIDIEPAGIAQAVLHAAAAGLADRAIFKVADCNAQLPFADCSYDVVVCIDAILHLRDRVASLKDWARILKPGGTVMFSDAAILTGAVSKQELDIRASQGEFVFVPPGANEKAIAAAQLRLVRQRNTTAELAAIAGRLWDVRESREAELVQEEGRAWFDQRQRFLAMTARLAAEGRLSRQVYVAEKP
jgi:ubiquinone/menaquinone biosynthesis C-methylase UbiE